MAVIGICDDDRKFGDLVVDFLQAQGYTAWLAVDPVQFGALVKKYPPDLVILDMQMTGGGGPAAVNFLQSQPETAELPVIFSSGMPAELTQRWFSGLKAARFLQKPIEFPKLVDNIKALLGPARP